METKKHLFHWCRVPIGNSVPMLRWAKTLSLVLCLLTLGIQNAKAAMDFETWNGSISRQPTWNEPWGEFPVSFYNCTDDHSYFTYNWLNGCPDKGPAIYIDGNFIGNPWPELAWPNNQKGIEGERGNNSWWKNNYEKTVNGTTYTVRFYDPGRTNNTYSVLVVPYIWHLELDKSHSVTIKGYFQTHGQSAKLVSKTWTFNALWFPFSSGPTGAKMTDYNHFSINGPLSSSHDPVTVGTTANANGSRYISASDLSDKKEYSSSTSSYSNLVLTINRSDYYNRVTHPVEYIFKKNVSSRGDFYLYKWFHVSLPGFVRAKNLQAETDLWNKKITIKWDADESDSRCKEGLWRIYRRLKSESEWTLLTSSDLAYNQHQYVDTDANLEYDKDYEYKVIFIPKNSPSDMERSELSQTVTGQLARPASFFPELGNTRKENSVVLNWKHDTPTNNTQLTFKVWRCVDRNSFYDQNNQLITSKIIEAMGTDPIANVSAASSGNTTTYEDEDLASNCTSYWYRISTEALGTTFYSGLIGPTSMSGSTEILNVYANRGTYANVVKVQWDVKQIGTSPSRFVVSRRLLGSDDDDEYQQVYVVSGTESSYFFEDNTAQPGQYYQYRVVAQSNCVDNETGETSYNVTSMGDADGFCQSRGVVSGRITYGTGTAVADARVLLSKNKESGDETSQFYSMRVNPQGGILWAPTSKTGQTLFASKPFTFQLYVRPETVTADGSTIIDGGGDFAVMLKPATEADKSEIYLKVGDGDAKATGMTLQNGSFTQVCVSNNGGTEWTVRTIDVKKEMASTIVTAEAAVTWSGNYVVFGSDQDFTTTHGFTGYLDDIRLWSKALTEAEMLGNYDRLLVGTEPGLKLYWPVDEGVNRLPYAYDYSKTSGVANENHGLKQPNTSFASVVPEESQLSLYGKTDGQGNYVVRGVPYSGDGTNYMVTPVMNNHEFSPQYQSRYVSSEALNHSAVDFTDISSFRVSGTIRYAGTNIPVDSVQIYVDGRMATSNNEAVVTDENGEFVVDVPIGRHYVSAVKDGHTFVNEGRIPADPTGLNETTYEFIKPESGWQFWDNTLVKVAGRVVGGAIEGEKPLGFGESKNTIGKAVITLEVPDTRYMLNAYEDNDGLVSRGFNPVTTNTPLTYPKETASTGVGYRTGGTLESQAQRVVITTDAATGEFAVLLPPLDYKVLSVQMENADARDAYTFNAEQLPRIDASNPTTELKDSIPTDNGGFLYFDYVASFKQTIHTEPVLSVRQMLGKTVLPEGVFGDVKAHYTIPTTGKQQEAVLYTVDDTQVTYHFDYPIFAEMGNYTFGLEGYETYTNYDEGVDEDKRETKVPLQNTVVTISNALSASQKVYAAAPETGKNAGLVADLQENQLLLDEKGKATYTWKAGLPNIQPPYTRQLNMTYNNGAGDYSWQGLEAIIFGDLPTGTNFTTKGPSKVDMVLHDPYGDSSFTTWESGKVTVVTKDTLRTDETEESLAANIHLGPKLEIEKGFLVSTQTEIEMIADFTVGYTRTQQRDTIDTHVTTLEVTSAISTSADPDMVGADADVYIGQGTNLLFGGARSVGLKVDDEGLPQVMVDDVITVGQEFETNFYYTQYEIENKVIPDLRKIRDELLITVPSITDVTNETDHTIYVTELNKDDKHFGEAGTYKALFKKAGLDMVGYYNDEIKNWQNQIAASEKHKLDRFANSEDLAKKNISFGGGVEITESESLSTTQSREITYTHMYYVDFGTDIGLTYNGIGADIAYESHNTCVDNNANPDSNNTNVGNGSETESNETTTTSTFSYTLADSSADDSFSINIYKASGNHGPVFRTMGGQSSCPYEGQELTKYYRPGEELSAATVQIEQPEIVCNNNLLTGVPTGGKAQFELLLRNNSGINADAYFELVPVDGANPKGAKLSLPTGNIGNGRTILVPAGEEVKMILTLEQGNLDVTDYENIKLALRSTCQNDETSIHGAIKSEVSLSAHFVPASTPVMLAINKTVVNTNNVDEDLTMKVTGFDRLFAGLKRVDLQYKAPGATTWSLLKGYIPNESVRTDGNQVLLPENGVIELPLNMKSSSWTDGTYEFRAQSSALYAGKNVTSESEVLTVVKDLSRPQLFGSANPKDGVLNSDEDISVTFNEDIQRELLTKNNFVVSGVLNGAQVQHNVALSAQGTEQAAYTEANINLAQKDFAADMWVRVTDAGDIFTHGNGTEKFEVGVNDDNKLVVKIGDQTYTSTKTIEKGVWTFLAFNYHYESGNSQLNARAVTANGTENLFTNEVVADYAGIGNIALGKHFAGAIHEVALWDTARGMEEAQAEMHSTKKPSTPHLIGYWKLDEGDGQMATDYARNRHLTLPGNTWYLNNDNKAVRLDGTNALKIDISECSALDTEDYAVEMWFKGAKADQSGASTLFYAGEESVGIGFSNTGVLTMSARGADIELSKNDYLDNVWHHLALNVLRNGNATVYVDGAPVKAITASAIPSLEGTSLYIGSRENTQMLKGSVDEIRFWKASMTGDLINSQRKQRLTGEESGLVAYYSFETMTRDATTGVISSVSSDKDLCTDTKVATLIGGGSGINYVDEAPAMKVKPVATNVEYNYVANERGIIITLNEEPVRLEGTTLQFTVKSVKDMNGNESMPVMWTAFVKQNQLTWKGETEVKVRKQGVESVNFEATFVNDSGDTENWSLSGLPAWLTASAVGGTLKAQLAKTITFTVAKSLPIGTYETTVYLTGSQGIATPLNVTVTSEGQVPDWSVNPRDFENSMNVIGQVKLGDKFMNDEGDMLAAFIGDECRGVAHLQYKPRYDGYFVTMDIYDNGEGDEKKEVTFRAYDASTGTVYPAVEPDQPVKFESLALIGKYDAPVVFDVLDEVEQSTELKAGWNWLSLNVTKDKMDVKTLFENIAEDVDIVKSQYDGWLMCEDGEWDGSLTADLRNEQMYAVRMLNDRTLRIVGKRVSPDDCPISVYQGWNWVGYYGRQTASVGDAMAGMQPVNGDILKAQSGVAYFDDTEWAGSIEVMEPGKGYMVNVNTPRTFGYPKASVAGARSLSVEEGDLVTADHGSFTPVDFRNYAGNAIMAAKIVAAGKPVTNAELGVFADGECRAAAMTNEKGVAYLTIPGDDAAVLTFKVAVDDKEAEAAESVAYEVDGVYGSPKHPFVIDLSGATGIEIVESDDERVEIYDLQGRKVTSENARLNKGVYIVNGRKQVVK